MSVSGALKKSSLPWVGIEHGGKRLAAAEEIQTYLASRGLYYGKVDGRYGRLTDAAVREYQTKHGITSDGKVGRVTAAIMDAEAAGAPIVAAKPTPQVFPYRNEYQALWDTIAVKPSWNRQIDQRIDYLRRPDHWSEYVKLYKATGVPPQVTAVIHERESSGDLKGVLHNGEAIIGTGKKTKLVPAGHGPFNSFFDAGVDAYRKEGLDRFDWKAGGPARVAYALEKFNGFGYRKHGIPSPYLWSGTQHYVRGKYIRDGVFSRTHVDTQLGGMTLLKRMMDKDPALTFG
jgi:lysozyme family protein